MSRKKRAIETHVPNQLHKRLFNEDCDATVEDYDVTMDVTLAWLKKGDNVKSFHRWSGKSALCF